MVDLLIRLRKVEIIYISMMVNDTLITLHIDILVEPLDGAHGGLDVETLHVLPVLLQQGDQEVHGEMDVLDELLLSHPDTSYFWLCVNNIRHDGVICCRQSRSMFSST